MSAIPHAVPPRPPRASDDASAFAPSSGVSWMLAIGGLIAAVCVVRLTAAHWSVLTGPIKALVLIAGALAIAGAGAAARRLRIVRTADALDGLFVALVPLLAWGAAYRDLLGQTGGPLVVVLGFGALLDACRRLLRRRTGYAGRAYPIALGTLLLATLGLPSLLGAAAAAGGVTAAAWAHLAAAIALGGVLAVGCRRINGHFFHRDRIAEAARPLALLPFALLIGAYALALTTAATLAGLPIASLALVIACVGHVLLDVGHDYVRALQRIGQLDADAAWPTRSRALLAAGAVAMTIGFAVSWLGISTAALAQPTALAQVAILALAGHRLLIRVADRPVGAGVAWAYGAALSAFGLAAYLLPLAVPATWRLAARMQMADAFGLSHHDTAISGLAVLIVAGVLVLLASVFERFTLRRALSPRERAAHAWIVAALTLIAVPMVAGNAAFVQMTLGLAIVALMLATTLRLRHTAPLLVAHAGALVTATSLPLDVPFGHADEAVMLGAVNLLVAVLAVALRKRLDHLVPNASRRLAQAVGWTSLMVTPFMLFVSHDLHSAIGLIGLALAAAIAGTTLRSAVTLLGAGAAWAAGIYCAVDATTVLGGDAELAVTLLILLPIWAAVLPALRRRAAPTLAHAIAPVHALGNLAIHAGIAVLTIEADSLLTCAPALIASVLLLAPRLRDAFADRPMRGQGFEAVAGAVLLGLGLTRAIALGYTGLEGPLLGVGVGLIALAAVLHRNLGQAWTARIATAGAAFLYAAPGIGLIGQLDWTRLALLLVFAVVSGLIAFPLRSRGLLILATLAVLFDLGVVLLHLQRAAPVLLWAAGLGAGLALMAAAGLVEHRNLRVLQQLRIWGHGLRAWN
ncbi:MAG: hypothetical protein AAF772_06580 [Acidobacteriota bacterium]